MRNVDKRDLEKIGARDGSDKTIAILGDTWWPLLAKQEGDNTCEKMFM